MTCSDPVEHDLVAASDPAACMRPPSMRIHPCHRGCGSGRRRNQARGVNLCGLREGGGRHLPRVRSGRRRGRVFHCVPGKPDKALGSVQLAIEDFAVKNSGTYPVAGDDAAVKGNMPGGNYPVNPFSGARDAWTWVAPAASGIIGTTTVSTTGYTIQGFGKTAMLPLSLTNG